MGTVVRGVNDDQRLALRREAHLPEAEARELEAHAEKDTHEQERDKAMMLAKFELRWARLAFTTIYPGFDGLAGIAAMDTDAFLVELCRVVPLKSAMGLRLGIWLVALAPLFVLRRFATITGLAVADRERMIATLLVSPSYVVRQLVLILKTMGAMLYAGSAVVRARLNGAAPMKTGARPLAQIRLKRVQAA